TLTSTMLDELTVTSVITEGMNPRASTLSWYNPGKRLPNRYSPFSSLEVEYFCESEDLVAVIVAPLMAAPLGSMMTPLMAPSAPEKTIGELTGEALDSLADCSATTPVNLATSKSSKVPSFPSAPALRR